MNLDIALFLVEIKNTQFLHYNNKYFLLIIHMTIYKEMSIKVKLLTLAVSCELTGGGGMPRKQIQTY